MRTSETSVSQMRINNLLNRGALSWSFAIARSWASEEALNPKEDVAFQGVAMSDVLWK